MEIYNFFTQNGTSIFNVSEYFFKTNPKFTLVYLDNGRLEEGHQKKTLDVKR